MKQLMGLALAGLWSVGFFQAQAQTQSRTYANFQGSYRTGLYALGLETVFGNINDAGLAADNDPRTFSSPFIPAGLVGLAGVTQYLGFTTDGSLNTVRQISAGVPVTVKLSLPQSLLGLADAVEVGVYSGLQHVSTEINGTLGTGTGNADGYRPATLMKLYGGASLVNLLNGAGELELPMTPSHNYEGVYVRLSGDLLSLALSMKVFDAYIMENNNIPCPAQGNAIDVLSGIRGNGLVNLLSATGTILQPWAAADRDADHLNTFSTISTGALVLSEVFETVVFNTSSKPGDSLQLVISDPGSGLLDLNLLAALKLTTYNGLTPGSIIGTGQAGLSLRLLPSSSGRYMLSIPMNTSFDRVEVSLGGVANVLSTLRIYDVRRTMPQPVITGSTGTRSVDTIIVYKGTPLVLNAYSSDPVGWYSTGGSWLADGPSYSIPAVTTDGTYTARSLRNGCSQNSSSYRIHVKVIEHLTLPVRELYFSGAADNERITLRWTAKGESEVGHYTLQKYVVNSGFVDIANIFATGNNSDTKYEFPDKSPIAGSNLYRLIIHDQSGAFHYSNTTQVLWGIEDQSGKFNVFPNPSSENSVQYLSGLAAGDYTLQIISASGKTISQSNIRVAHANTPAPFQAGNLTPGVYWLTVTPAHAGSNAKRMAAAFRIQ